MCAAYDTLDEAIEVYKLPGYAQFFDVTEHTAANGTRYVEVYDKADDSTAILSQGHGAVRSSGWMWSADEVNEYKRTVGIPLPTSTPQVAEQAV